MYPRSQTLDIIRDKFGQHAFFEDKLFFFPLFFSLDLLNLLQITHLFSSLSFLFFSLLLRGVPVVRCRKVESTDEIIKVAEEFGGFHSISLLLYLLYLF